MTTTKINLPRKATLNRVPRSQRPQKPRNLDENASTRLKRIGDFEVRLTPVNKVFLTNCKTKQVYFPSMRGSSVVQFSESVDVPEPVVVFLKRVLNAQRMVREMLSVDRFVDRFIAEEEAEENPNMPIPDDPIQVRRAG